MHRFIDMECEYYIIMHNRWGRTVEPKPPARAPGQNYININFNFNAVKDKPSAIQGKKIDNFIQVNNEQKSHPVRPNVSMETLKQKKKKNTLKQQIHPNAELHRKKSKSRFQDAFTPEKKTADRPQGDSRSMNKKSTKKRNSRSTQNLRFFHREKSPESNSRSKSNSNEKYNSRSKSRSQSAKKFYKNNTKSKTGLISRPRTAGNSTAIVRPAAEEKAIPKAKKSVKKVEQPSQGVLRKKSQSAASRKKLSHDQSRKIVKPAAVTKPRKKSKQKDNKQLQRPPLYHGEQENFDEEGSYKKLNNEAHRLLYEEAVQNIQADINRGIKRQKKRVQKVSLTKAYHRGDPLTAEEMKKLQKVAITIQRYWRGFRARTQVINEIKMMHYKIQLNKKRIEEQDPKFWDDARSNSIIRAEDAESSFTEDHTSLKSDIDRPISQSQSQSQKGLSQNRIIEHQYPNDVLERLSRLEEEMKIERSRNRKLEEENKDLKVTLQKVTASVVNSGLQSMESSVRSNMDGWEQLKIRPEGQMENNSCQSQQFQLRLPRKIENRINKQDQRLPPPPESYSHTLEEYKNRMEAFECSSPKYSQRSDVNIDRALVELFRKKEDSLRENYQKKSAMFENLLKDSFYSPRTYNYKKNQLDNAFAKEAGLIKSRLQEATRAIQFAQETGRSIESPKQEKKTHHVIEDYRHVDLNSHRDNTHSDSSPEQMRSEVEIQQEVKIQIEATNEKAIKIFQQIEESNHSGLSSNESRKAGENNESEGSREVQVEKVNRGFETTLLFIKDYCVSFFEFLRGSEEHQGPFLQGICTSIEYDPQQFLKSYRTTINNENETSYNSQYQDYIYPYFKFLFPKSQVISREAFMEFNQVYEKLKNSNEFDAERDYFLNSLLDAFNESFDYERPCSYYGQSPPWISDSRTLKNHPLEGQSELNSGKFIDSIRFEQACGRAIARVIQWSTSLCGFIPQSPDVEDMFIEQQQINTIRETRIALMLEKDLLQKEEEMLDSGIEQSEIKLQLGKVILEHLVQEFLREGAFFN